MNRKFFAIHKVSIWNKVFKGLIPILLCVTAIATLPEQKDTTWFIEKTIEKEEKEEKENNKTEQVDTEEELSYDISFKKAKSKKKIVKTFLDSFIPVSFHVFSASSCFTVLEKKVIQLNINKARPFYILCHQLVFYEG